MQTRTWNDLTDEEQQAYHRQWIRDIATHMIQGTCDAQGILEHIQKHSGPDLLGYVRAEARGQSVNWMEWSASMHNLLEIADAILMGRQPTADDKLARLQRHFERNKNRTPPPAVPEPSQAPRQPTDD